MSELSAFFAQNVQTDVMEEFVVSTRFKGADGQPVAWKLRTMDEDENEYCRKAATKHIKNKGGQRIPETDYNEYITKLIATSVVFPNLKDAELQKSYGILGECALLKKMLLPGEYATLTQKIQEMNGFDRDMSELVEDVKN
ncbi:phage portal protein [Paenibacillus baekrokdamisoli]|uniref:Phage portal protein n=1 Tax=Paenibacillus baekrokdamisoli TaxID=1712516 RepID=A0A3G9ILZ8_9BACL|nr:phage portal protein [Paenibacillus baekrokdamisoli]MBB3070510.1 hypothetical protein [Paenibacillus baekrokdamisoli]BBH19860.1 phage portal protein [Paenibacillus baekrokdamisoli]